MTRTTPLPPAPAAPTSSQEITVGTATTSLSLGVSPSTGTVGTAISASSITGTLSGGVSPTGTIKFYESGPGSAPSSCPSGLTLLGSAVSVTGNTAYNPTAGFTPSTAGDYWLYASYSGDTNNAAAASPSAPTSSQEITVGTATTSLSLGVSPSTGTVGTAISASSITGTLSGGVSPTGTIKFYESGPGSAPSSCPSGLTLLGSAVSVTGNTAYNPTAGFTPSTAGDYWLYASYSGDTNNAAAASPCAPTSSQEITVGTATTSLSLGVSPSTGTVGTTISASSITGTLSGGVSPTGTIKFYESGPGSAPSSCPSGLTLLGSAVSVTGNTAYNPTAGFTPSTAGDYWLYASYSGDTNNAAAASPCAPTSSQEITVGTATTSLSLGVSPSTGTVGTAISASSITGTLSGGVSPTGTIKFYESGPGSAPSSCPSGLTLLGSAVSVTGNTAYNPTAGFTPSTAGDYWLYRVLQR